MQTPLQIDAVVDIVQDPLSALLLLIGAALTGFSLLYFGYLSLRGVAAAAAPEPGEGPPRQPR